MNMAMALAHEFDPEAPVIEAIRGGDRCAFGEFVRRHNDWVRGVIFGVVGDDGNLYWIEVERKRTVHWPAGSSLSPDAGDSM